MPPLVQQQQPVKPQYPYPECESIVQWLKENTGDPASLEIIQWLARGEIDEMKSARDYPKAMRWRAPNPNPYILVRVKYRAKNNVGAMAIYEQAFSCCPGGKLGVGEKINLSN